MTPAYQASEGPRLEGLPVPHPPWKGKERSLCWSRASTSALARNTPVPPTSPPQSWQSWRHYLCELTQGGIPSWPLPHGPLSSDPQILVWPWAVELPMPRSSP